MTRNLHKEIADLQYENIKLRRQLHEAIKVITSTAGEAEVTRVTSIKAPFRLSDQALWEEIGSHLGRGRGVTRCEFENLMADLGIIVTHVSVTALDGGVAEWEIRARNAEDVHAEVVVGLSVYDGLAKVTHLSTRYGMYNNYL